MIVGTLLFADDTILVGLWLYRGKNSIVAEDKDCSSEQNFSLSSTN